MIIQEPVNEINYSVTNLNIVIQNGIESYFLTKYIPADGKPFFNYSQFVGIVQYLDLNGNILSSTSVNKNQQIMVRVGCSMLIISTECGHCSWSTWELVGVFDVCPGGGGVGGETQGGNNGGYTPGESGGGGGGTGGTPTQPNIPNIPSENDVHVKRYKSFLTIYLTQEEVDILITNQNLSDHLFNYLSSMENNFSPSSKNNVQWFMNFYTQTPDAEPFSIFDFGTKFIKENTDIVAPQNVFLRIYALEKFIEMNPDGLLDIPCTKLSLWQDVSKYQIPQSVKNKIRSIPNQNSYWSSWNITDLESGAGARVNMDLFPVRITTMPKKPNSTQRYTPAEFFDFFRKNINLFAEKFTPLEDNHYNIHDTALWNSSNPLGALIHINIPGDNGTVICSGFSTNAWIFSTIKAPLSWSYDGVHPVAGNRKFSYYTDPNDGSITIYTRGVDRLSNVISNNTPLINFLMESYGFSSADDLWTEMQTKLANYINARDGNATKVTPEIYRPNYSVFSDYLKGKSLISSLGCK